MVLLSSDALRQCLITCMPTLESQHFSWHKSKPRIAHAGAEAVSMGLTPSQRVKKLREKLRRFMEEHVYPAEPLLEVSPSREVCHALCPTELKFKDVEGL